jgi:serine/threonine protein phosphatase PrpC
MESAAGAEASVLLAVFLRETYCGSPNRVPDSRAEYEEPMTTDIMQTVSPPGAKPRDDEIDVYGLTHPGKVRQSNQDHFMIASVHKRLNVHLSSLPEAAALPFNEERLAYVAMVADGVGGGEKGGLASRLALETALEYVASGMKAYYHHDAAEERFIEELQEAAMRAHAGVLSRAEGDPGLSGMATTLTLWLGVWPWFYLLQVGDSRYYLYRGGKLAQVSRDQTVAQELLDQGVFTRTDAFRSKWAHVLSSAIGGRQTAPLVTRMQADWRNIHMLCSDGLTKHVSDERIKERLGTMTSAKQVCEALLQDALDDGGSDNITLIVGRAIRGGDQPSA